MKMISKPGGGIVILSLALFAFACAKSGAAPNQTNLAADAATKNSMAAPTISPSQNPEDKTSRISAEEAKKLSENGKAIIVDVRGTDAYKMTHIKGALDVSLNKLESGDFKDLPKDKQIIAYCTCPAEQSSGRAATLLQQNGFKSAAALVGGLHAWEAAGGATEKSAPEPAKKK